MFAYFSASYDDFSEQTPHSAIPSMNYKITMNILQDILII